MYKQNPIKNNLLKETDFIDQNKDKWQELELLLANKEKDPDQLSNLFVHITDDLSYSRTYYKNRSVRVYLNNTAQKIFKSIYKPKISYKKNFISFWYHDLPQVIWESRKELRLSFLIFSFAMFVGFFSSTENPEFLETILGKSYVEMTIENIEKNDPMAVYKQANEIDSFLGITLNNVLIAFRTFVYGIFFVVGAIGILFFNGVMVGAFQNFFVQHGVFWESFLTIWQHGTLEISSIIIAGGAGIVMGKGLVLPGTYSRIQALLISTKRGIKIILGISPIFIIAGFIEGFLTRYTDLPDIVRLTTILISLSYILSYYVYLPWKKSKAGFKNKKEKPLNFFHDYYLVSPNVIRKTGQIFTETFIIYRAFLDKISKYFILISFLWGITALAIVSSNFTKTPDILSNSVQVLWFSFWFQEVLDDLLAYDQSIYLFVTSVVFMIVLFSFLSIFIKKSFSDQKELINNKLSKKAYFINLKSQIINLIIIISLFNVVFFINNNFLSFLATILLFPFICFWLSVIAFYKKNLFKSFTEAFNLIFTNPAKYFGLNLVFIFISLVCFLILTAPMVWFYFEFINWNLDLSINSSNLLFAILTYTLTIFVFSLITPLLYFGNAILYYSLHEIKYATGLNQKIDQFGDGTHKVYGIEQE